MKRSLPIRAPSRPVCQLCDYILQQPACRRSLITRSTVKAPAIRRQPTRQPARQHGVLPAIRIRSFASAAQVQVQESEPDEIEHPSRTVERTRSVQLQLKEVEAQIQAIYDSPKIEPEEATLRALQGLLAIAKSANDLRAGRRAPQRLNLRQSSASAILMLNDSPETKTHARHASTTASLQSTLPSIDYLSNLALELVRNEKVFISPAVLKVYIALQTLLDRPRQIPEALHLYAHKPVPVLDSSPPKFEKRSPKHYKNAVPKDVADKALDAAIDAKDMSLALRVIDETYIAPGYIRDKIIRKLGLPGLAVTLTPLGLYAIAQEISVYSGYLDPTFFKWYAFAGLMTYVFGTGTLGFVALTTYNHHFGRVVWQPGTPLFERWLREDERWALDQIACAWGFKEKWKWGDEEGPEWDGLKKWCLLRGCILDKTDLMPGMNA